MTKLYTTQESWKNNSDYVSQLDEINDLYRQLQELNKTVLPGNSKAVLAKIRPIKIWHKQQSSFCYNPETKTAYLRQKNADYDRARKLTLTRLKNMRDWLNKVIRHIELSA